MNKALIFSLATSLIWSLGLVNSRIILLKGENPFNLTAWIFIVTAPLWLITFKNHARQYKELSLRNKIMLFVIGIMGSIGISTLQSLALKNTTAVNFAFLYRTIVIFTIIFAALFLKERITFKKIILTVFIILGSFFLTAKGQGLVFTKGDIYTVLMAASAAFVANILTKHTISRMHPDLSGSVTMLVSLPMLLILSLITGTFRLPDLPFLILVGGILQFLIIKVRNRAYQLATASFVTMILSVTPVFVSLWSLIFLRETLEGIQIVGGILIVASGFLAHKFKV